MTYRRSGKKPDPLLFPYDFPMNFLGPEVRPLIPWILFGPLCGCVSHWLTSEPGLMTNYGGWLSKPCCHLPLDESHLLPEISECVNGPAGHYLPPPGLQGVLSVPSPYLPTKRTGCPHDNHSYCWRLRQRKHEVLQPFPLPCDNVLFCIQQRMEIFLRPPFVVTLFILLYRASLIISHYQWTNSVLFPWPNNILILFLSWLPLFQSSVMV